MAAVDLKSSSSSENETSSSEMHSDESKGRDGSRKESWNSWALQMMVLFLVMVMWNTDNMALPAVYSEIAKYFNTTPGGLGGLGLVRGVFESIFALPSGFLADRLPRPLLICIGSAIWGAGLIGCAFAPDIAWMTGFRALNGVGLGIVQPLLFSLVADKSSVYGRGKAFGFLLSTGSLGQTAFTAFATSIAPLQIGAIAGWQFALTIIASLSVLVGLLVWCLVTDVPRAEQRSMLQIVKEETPRLGSILCLPTFLVIIGQGIFGTAPWFAFSYLTMWLELNCFANTEAATILAFFNVGTALSSMLGGILLDFIFRRFPDHGPPGISQVSVFLSIPLFALILFGLGHGDSDAGTIALYCSVFMVTGMLIAWNMVMNNKMFSDVVPRERYTYIYALDRCIEGTFGAFGQPAVGWLTDRIFHFDAEMANSKHCSPSDALSLGKGVFSVAAVGFGICFLFYCVAHCTYPRDRRRAEMLKEVPKQDPEHVA
ncbi:unnamed protein product [Durusdinium trenchii]|uniref:Major facilitator superfamily (MFS) profile domain-containing protein n=2 Tax=Durusdinium trenchii TaxID=1381693 RepID=A0ABP0RAN4_9DINO